MSPVTVVPAPIRVAIDGALGLFLAEHLSLSPQPFGFQGKLAAMARAESAPGAQLDLGRLGLEALGQDHVDVHVLEIQELERLRFRGDLLQRQAHRLASQCTAQAQVDLALGPARALRRLHQQQPQPVAVGDLPDAAVAAVVG
jgi:hypothetical protein